MHSCLRWWTRMWMIQIADLTVKKYKSGINTYVVKIQKLTILTSPLLFEAQIGKDLQKKTQISGNKYTCCVRIGYLPKFALFCPYYTVGGGNQRVSRFGLVGYYRFSGFKENVGSWGRWLLQTFYRRGQCQSVRGVGGASGTIGFEELINWRLYWRE